MACFIQVLRLFHFLVKFGYYRSEEILALLKPLLLILECRHDKPFPPDNDKGGESSHPDNNKGCESTHPDNVREVSLVILLTTREVSLVILIRTRG